MITECSVIGEIADRRRIAILQLSPPRPDRWCSWLCLAGGKKKKGGPDAI
jgi:hypothetical protein